MGGVVALATEFRIGGNHSSWGTLVLAESYIENCRLMDSA